MIDYHWTPAQMRSFLEALAETGCVADACTQVSKSRRAAYYLRNRHDGRAFNLGWNAAVLNAKAVVTDLLMERVILGETVETVKNVETGRTTRVHHPVRLSLGLFDRLERMTDASIEQEMELEGDMLRADAVHRVIAQDFEAFLDLVEASGNEAEILAFITARSPAAKRRNMCELARKSEPEPLDDEAQAEADAGLLEVWHCDEAGDWRTNYPPPPNFTGEEEGQFGDDAYARSLSAAEEEAQEAITDAERALLAEAGMRARDAHFGFVPRLKAKTAAEEEQKSLPISQPTPQPNPFPISSREVIHTYEPPYDDYKPSTAPETPAPEPTIPDPTIRKITLPNRVPQPGTHAHLEWVRNNMWADRGY